MAIDPDETLRDSRVPRGIGSSAEESGLAGRMVGPYALVRELGHGGQGFVWLAEDSRLRRMVALKMLTRRDAVAEQERVRFLREAEAASKLQHPGICGIHEYGEHDGIPFIAMPFLEGETLDRAIRSAKAARLDCVVISSIQRAGHSEERSPSTGDRGSPGSDVSHRDHVSAVVRLIEQAARALDAAHEVGLVHRDIKPGNIMATTDARAVILDFGLARDESREGETLTATGDLLGTPAYMSPEQLAGSRVAVDHRSDVYSLGVTLFECLALERPFESTTREGLYHSILTDAPRDIRKWNPAVNRDLKTVIECALEKDRDRRYSTAAALADDLRAVLESRPISARKVGVVGRILRWSRRRPAAATLAAALILGVPLITGLGGFIWARLPDIRAQERVRLDEQIEEIIELGLFESIWGSQEAAEVHFRAALALDPTSLEAAIPLAFTLVKLDRGSEALEVMDSAQRRLTDPGRLAGFRSEILHALGRVDEAREAAESASEPDTPELLFLEGWRAEHRGRRRPLDSQAEFLRSERLLTLAVASSPRPRRVYCMLLAAVAGNLGADGSSGFAGEVLVSLWPEAPLTPFLAGFAVWKTEPEVAAAHFREAVRCDPTFVLAIRNLGIVLGRTGNHEESAAAFRKALAVEPLNAELHTMLADALFAAGDQVAAVASHREALRLAPRNVQFRRGLALALRRTGDVDAAVELYREVTRLAPDDGWGQNGLSNALEDRGDLDGALEAARQSIRLAPRVATFHSQLAQVLEKIGDHDGEVAALREAVRLDAGDSVRPFALGRALLAHGPAHDAVRALDQATRLAPENASAFDLLARALATENRIEEAADAAREAIRLRPERASYSVHLGSILERSGDLDGALDAYRRAIAVDPGENSAPAHARLGWILKGQGDVRGALEEFREATRLGPRLDEAFEGLGHCLRDDDAESAIEAYGEAMRLNPENGRARLALGWLHWTRGESKLARAAFDVAFRQESSRSEAHEGIGQILQDEGRLTDAIDRYREAIRINPRLGMAYFRLGTALASDGDLRAAVAASRMAVDLLPDREDAHLRLEENVRALIAELEDDDEIERAIELLVEYAKAYPDVSWYRSKLRRLQADR